jgi:hypothetical protein
MRSLIRLTNTPITRREPQTMNSGGKEVTCGWKFRILQGQGIGSLNFSLQRGTNDHS